MKNKKSFADGEANEWFKRNIAIIEDNRDDAHISLLIDWLEPFKNEIFNILEIGCGSGHFLDHISKSLSAKGHGIDPSDEAIDYIKDNFPNLEVFVGFGDDVPISETFDLVHLGFFLYLVDREYYLRCISEADRLVKFGGFLSIIDFETPFPYSNQYSHKTGVFSHKQNNSDVFTATGLYSIVNKFHFSHNKFSFDKNIDERLSVTLLYKETKIFSGY